MLGARLSTVASPPWRNASGSSSPLCSAPHPSEAWMRGRFRLQYWGAQQKKKDFPFACQGYIYPRRNRAAVSRCV